jgi:hypothetical protein
VVASFEPRQTWIAVSGAIGAAVGAYAVNRESLRLDRANAGGYEKAAAAADALAVRYELNREFSPRTEVAAVSDQCSTSNEPLLDHQAARHLLQLDGIIQEVIVRQPLRERLPFQRSRLFE